MINKPIIVLIKMLFAKPIFCSLPADVRKIMPAAINKRVAIGIAKLKLMKLMIERNLIDGIKG